MRRPRRRKTRKDRRRSTGSPLALGGGLEIVTTARRIRRPDDLRGLAAGTRAVSVFLVNRRDAVQGHDEIKDRAFIFQASLTVEGNRPFVPRPNPRGGVTDEEDERIADLQYRDALEFAVGHAVAAQACGRRQRRVLTR